MKKLILLLGSLAILSSLGLKAYFAFVPPPEPTLERSLAEIFPQKMTGWIIEDKDMAESEEASERISAFLNFDDSLFRVFRNGETFVGLYVAYWTPGKASYRWAGAHTPDTCWVLNGWTREDRKYAIPFSCDGTPVEPAEFGVYAKDGIAQNVYFWHLVGGEAFTYDQKGTPNIFGALKDVQAYGLNLRQEQFFIRLSSNRTIEELREYPEFRKITRALKELFVNPDVSQPALLKSD
ncbi:MAG: exosortase-associated EpsI family protein [Verrucomicrobiota bacterium]